MELIFRDDPYARSCEATVTAVDDRGIRLDRTVFYPMGGGQPGDTGRLVLNDGTAITITDTVKGDDDAVVHVPADDARSPAVGSTVTAEIDWERRHRLMRMHSALHLLSALVDGKVAGGQVGADRSRLDFDVQGEIPEKDDLTAALNRFVAEDHPVRPRWVTDDELAAQPELVKTMSVAPPTGTGRVRLVEVEGIDLQACGGTHVTRTSEIGPLKVAKIENKGRRNRRFTIALADA